MMLQMARTQDYFWSLGVERDASTADDRSRLRGARAQLPRRSLPPGPDDDRRMAQEIFDSLAEAHRVAARSRPAARLHRQARTRATTRRAESRRATDVLPTPAASSARGRRRRRAARPTRSTRSASSTCAPAATTRPSRCSARRRASSPTRPTTARRSGGPCFARRPPTRGPPAPRSPSCAAPPRSTSATAAPPQHLAEIYAQTGQPEAAIAGAGAAAGARSRGRRARR